MNQSEKKSSGNATFPARLRLKKREEFQYAFQKGQVVADGVLVMHAVLAEQGGASRMGISVAKKVGNAPLRNYWKRLIREAFRTQKCEFPSGVMIIVRPKRGAKPELNAIKKSMRSLLRRVAKKIQAS